MKDLTIIGTIIFFCLYGELNDNNYLINLALFVAWLFIVLALLAGVFGDKKDFKNKGKRRFYLFKWGVLIGALAALGHFVTASFIFIALFILFIRIEDAKEEEVKG